MSKLFLTRNQARQLATDLKEYSEMKDSSNRELFEGFQISFADGFRERLQKGSTLEVTPIPNWTEIDDD